MCERRPKALTPEQSMVQAEAGRIWQSALESYCYPFDLGTFAGRDAYPEWFDEKSDGSRDATKSFEERFREHGYQCLEVWYEVVYWKLYSQRGRATAQTEAVIKRVTSRKLAAGDLWRCCCDYVRNPSRDGIKSIARLLFREDAREVAVASTFPAFMAPDHFPMIDTRVAKWAARNAARHNAADPNGPELVMPKYPANGATVLTLSDWPFAESWIYWCRHTAARLRSQTGFEWRARDVEMAIFSASGAGARGVIELPPLARMP